MCLPLNSLILLALFLTASRGASSLSAWQTQQQEEGEVVRITSSLVQVDAVVLQKISDHTRY